MALEGIDYSRGGPMRATSVKAAGKAFVGRYAVSDLSPNGRGITAAEYREMTAAGIEVFVYWEAETSWMLGGYDRGARAAENALANLRRAGMPERMPVYYSHDIEPEARHYAAVDNCLRGAASVVGLDGVGLYGGYGVIAHVAANGLAPYLCQTYAWSGGLLHPAAHLYQYDNYGNYVGGVDVDLVRALRSHYGQASDFLAPPTTTTTTTTANPHPATRIPAPDVVQAQGHLLTENDPDRFVATHGGYFKTAPSREAPNGTPTPYLKGDERVYTFPWTARVDDEDWLISRGGSWTLAKNFAPA